MLSTLLDPEVRWGDSANSLFGCRNRAQVLTWYQRGRDAGTRARILAISELRGRLLVELGVDRPMAPGAGSGTTARWQLLTVADDRITEIVGFETQEAAIERVSAEPYC